MSGTENLWDQIFQDKPVSEARLANLRLNVMRQITEHPQDFQGQLLLAARKRWGMILVGLFAFGGLLAPFFVLINGYFLAELIKYAAGKVILILIDIKPVITFLWDNYSLYLLSVLVLLVVLYRSENRTMDGRGAN
ncbi:MAG TPA: hypothetical protein VN374_03680 [Desulfitobacteriaceae bacterium]|nr:hypothetical protein [Desulfitobacteriaceae bacterium]